VTNKQFMGVVAVIVAAAGLGVLMGCSSQSDNSNNGDLKGVQYRKPDKIEGYLNVDGQPNLTRLCIDGQAFLTSSRDYDAVLRVPEWNTWCTPATAK
jgi:hypothetical protein